DTARAALRLLIEHTSKHRTAVLELAVVEAKSAVSAIHHQSEAAIAEAEAELHSRRAAIELENTRLARIQRQIQQCQIKAPRDGIVVLANAAASRTAVSVEEGATLRPRQPILKMPDMQRPQLRVHVHETGVHRVRPGQAALLRFDAFPDRDFRGTVTAVNDAPEPSTWLGSGNGREYAVLVSIENPTRELRLGLTALVEIDVSASNQQD
ncbi:MAG TPA: efflux RND transporter periplasmic adaptor subunit, partial [Thermoguttaceae bacterium]|nr:efflux RND transporter periplasmic adaptor subunit [Thermoguttaceae bacterium]